MLKGFKKIGQSDSHTIFQHEDGHILHVANSAVDKSKRNEMKRIPIKSQSEARIGYADGGTVLDEMTPEGANFPAYDGPEMPLDPNLSTPLPQQSVNQRVNAPPQQPMQQDQFSNIPGYNEEKQAANYQQQLDSANAESQSKMFQQERNAQQHLYDTYQKKMQETGTALDQMMADAKAQHIEPNHYLDSMSSGKKVTTAIGLLLGGMGAGADNPALAFLNKQIDRDLEAQKANASNKHNLYTALQQQYGHDVAASNMFRLFRADMMANEMGKLAATAKNPQAKINALNASSALMQKYLPLKRQTDMMLTLSDIQKQGQQGNDRVPQLLNQMRVVDPKQAEALSERYVPGIGIANIKVEPKMREELATRNALDKEMSSLEEFAQKNAGSLDPRIINEGKAKARLVQDAYRRGNQQGVFREAEKKFVDSIVDQDPTKFFAKFRTLPGYRSVRESNNTQLNSLLETHGLPKKELQSNEIKKSTNDQELEYAKTNKYSNDPKIQKRVQFINQKYGR